MKPGHLALTFVTITITLYCLLHKLLQNITVKTKPKNSTFLFSDHEKRNSSFSLKLTHTKVHKNVKTKTKNLTS